MDVEEVMARILFTDPTEEEREFLEKEMIKIINNELDEEFIKEVHNVVKGLK